MTFGNVLTNMGIGGNKLASERYSDYSGHAHDPHLFYTYEPQQHVHKHVASSKHGYGGKKHHAAMSALTLLAFLFFLHILQQCLREHMQAMSTTPIMIMTAGREGEEKIDKKSDANKIDKSSIGNVIDESENDNDENFIKKTNDFDEDKEPNSVLLTRIKTEQHRPKMDPINYKHLNQHYNNESSSFPGFVSVVDKDYF